MRAATRLLDLPDPPTASFAFNDMLAVGALQAAKMKGLCVPDQLSVIGFDDTVLSRYLSPALTTVRQPLAEMAGEAIRLVRQLSLDARANVARRLELTTTLVERRSAVARGM